MTTETFSHQEIIDAQLDLLQTELEAKTYLHYPKLTERFYLGATACDRLIVPDGPWAINNHPNRPDIETLPDTSQQLALLDQGYRLDGLGRPLHPWFEIMADDPTIGVVGGKGAYWSWGPNQTADSIIIHNDEILLIKRSDTGDLALPGGFINKGELPLVAAKREVQEETGVNLKDIVGKPSYAGPVADLRMTAHAWPETNAFLFELLADSTRPEAIGSDDAIGAIWKPLSALGNVALFGSHRLLIELALNR